MKDSRKKITKDVEDLRLVMSSILGREAKLSESLLIRELIIKQYIKSLPKEEICRQLIGMEESAGQFLIQMNSYTARLRNKDGISYIGTADLKFDRINLNVDKGIITKAEVG